MRDSDDISPYFVLKARGLAYEHHLGQKDKLGVPYIEHVKFVATVVAIAYPFYDHRNTVQAVAWLHDIVEDTDVTIDDLRRKFPTPVVEAVDAITKRTGESRKDYYARVKANSLARWVKLNADIVHNTLPARMAALEPEDRTRLKAKYAEATEALL